MKKNFEEFRDFLTNLNYEFSVISLTETWCLDDPRNDGLFKLKNYTSLFQARNGERNGGGTCFYIHNSLTFNKRSDLCVSNNDIESLSIEIMNPNSNKKPFGSKIMRLKAIAIAKRSAYSYQICQFNVISGDFSFLLRKVIITHPQR